MTDPQQPRPALPAAAVPPPAGTSRARLRATGRVAATVTALAAVSTGVVAATDVAGPSDPVASDRVGLAEAEVARRAPGPEVADRADTPGLRAAQGAARERRRAEAERARAEQAERERERAAVRAAQQRRQAAARNAARNAVRDPRGAARAMLADHGWSGSQFSCLDALWTKESGWNPRARNPSSGAFGIPQALPAGKMSSAGADWATNPLTQVRWGLRYIADVYGSPCRAWAHSRATNWY